MQKLSHYLQKFAGFLLILTLFTSVSAQPAAAAQEGEPFLTTLAVQPAYDLKPQQNRLGAVRVQPVTFRADVLNQVKRDLAVSSQKLSMQIFSDLELEITFEEQTTSFTGTTLLSGSVMGDPQGWIHLAETDGMVSADLVYQNIQYQLRQKDGLYVFTEIDQSQFPQEADPIIPELSFANQTPQALDVAYDSGAYVDVLVVYTATARSYEGGTTAIQNLINLAVKETNDGYVASGVNQHMRLMHTEEVDYSETNFDWGTALNNLKYVDNVIDNVHDLRDTYGADLVVMIVSNTDYCGIGYLLPVNSSTFSQFGFSVVSSNCATGYYSFGHETGHNMGAHHDREVTEPAEGLFEYSYGYIASNDSFRTIMAYGNFCNSCYRVNRWSNPDVSYNGLPTGVLYTAPDSADNRRTLNNSANAVANFRQSKLNAASNLTKTSSGPFSVSLQFTDNSSIETGHLLQRSLNGSAWTTLIDLQPNTVSYLDTNNVNCQTQYYYRVITHNLYTNTEASNIVPVVTGTCVAPDAAVFPSAIPSLTQITLMWTDTLGETSYTIQQLPDGSSSWVNVSGQTLPANTTQTTVVNLTKNTTYYFRIAATNAYGTKYTAPLTVKTHSQVVYIPLTVR
ncbi:MAG: hypothetical protein CL609_14340 [Anaerolineaceae bacterium]|nr:hypothetical protein [Anaerolineaceae bacterium]